MRRAWSRLRDPRGQIGVFMLAGIVGLLGVTGLAVDFGLGFGTERRAQAAADAAARAGAEKLPGSDVSIPNASASSLAGLNYGSTLVSQTSCPSISLPSGSFPGTVVGGNCFYILCSFASGYDTISVVAQKSVTGIFSKLALDGKKRATASACPVKSHRTAPLVIGLGQACGGSACFHGDPPVSDDRTYQVCDSLNGGPDCGGGSAKNFMVIDLNAVGGTTTPDSCLPTIQVACWTDLAPYLQNPATNSPLLNPLDKVPRVPTKIAGTGGSTVQYTKLNFALATSQPMPIAIGNPGGGGGCQGGGAGNTFKLQGQECPQVVGFGLFQLTSFACVNETTGGPAGCDASSPNVVTITGHWVQRTEQVNSCLPGDTSCRFFGTKAIYLVG
jgi:Putative Flp pilus-assembly TadE/G-like